MKTLPAILIIAVASIALAGDRSPRQIIPPLPDGATVGRFQLVAATVDDSERPSGRHRIFRIDTATGQVWRYERAIIATENPEVNSVDADGWVVTDEDFIQSIETARETARSLNDLKPKPKKAKPDSDEKK